MVALAPRVSSSDPKWPSRALATAERAWFAVTVVGQWAFLAYLVGFYGTRTVSGHPETWTANRMVQMSYVKGDFAGNVMFGAHVLLASIIAFGGALQLVPAIRAWAPAVHRWNGRLFLTVAMLLAVDGLYLEWVRGDRFSLISAISITGNALVILSSAVLAWTTALRRDFESHRRWATWTYLAANAQWFTRVAVFAWILLAGGEVGMTDSFDGPVNIVTAFGCYLIPIAIFEIWRRGRVASAGPRLAVAGLLGAATAFTALGACVYSAMSLGLAFRG